ncbi:PQQ-dependent catabolism-associated CXXCW motif protein [Paracoccus versutus]|uniref:PQQ-dependent catabolism-associated CXXCW motif protein n=1 Tax=Paracoccus versutus TaxID=34007 RepID=A0AAQ0HKD3_PARVE|nr:PQQ-dependent catabolism-associated CXXCW motif protein [Paracoccus versutus]KGJ10882.1 rhodanese [Paracoccus versutus]REG55519.1 PQQ-dependent catabolism-associated CXXCW motif protein [Paracoccus versutus]WEJ78437.1 PQQ-dependent catabolism-associated CXXCW motif protein [Paracoccus versutus]
MRQAWAALAVVVAGAVQAQAQVPEPQGFHGEPYRSETPATLAGARVIGAAEAMELHARGLPFIDVLPRTARPEGLPEGTLWNAPPHLSIPGATWLHGTGYERLSPVEQARLAEGLARLSGGDKAAPLVIFCKRDCWMSWNAARRAVALGYRGVIWFPDGIEGWQEQGGGLEPVSPATP